MLAKENGKRHRAVEKDREEKDRPLNVSCGRDDPLIKGHTPGGGPLQMLLTLTLNLLPASPKNSATGPTFGPF